MARRQAAARRSSLYCIDINTDTYDGIGYALGTWDAANVPNVGFVGPDPQRVLPHHPDATGRPEPINQKAAAVQAAIWFFSDRYVLSTVRPVAQRRGRDREPDQDEGAAGPAATAQPHHHPVG